MDLVLSFAFLSSFGIGLISCSNITIYIGGFIELNTTNGGWNSAGILPAVELAKTHINEESNVLKGIHLEVDMKDSKVRIATRTRLTTQDKVMKHFWRGLYNIKY